VLTRPIDWELIARQYDQVVKYATALRLGTAETEQVLRRFTRGGPKHPDLRRPGGTRPGGTDHLRLRLPRRPGIEGRDLFDILEPPLGGLSEHADDQVVRFVVVKAVHVTADNPAVAF
jgi:hypothetical protein